MRVSLKTFWSLFVISLLAVAFTLSSFTKTPAQEDMSPELLRYLASGGSYSDICNRSSTPLGAHDFDCALCRLEDDFDDTSLKAALQGTTSLPRSTMAVRHKDQRHKTAHLAFYTARAPPTL